MAKRRPRKKARPRPCKEVASERYQDAEGNALVLRRDLSAGSIAKIREGIGRPGASLDDEWQRREEMLFERLVLRWEAGGLPLTEQRLLLGRYRMASAEERRWLRETMAAHVARYLPGLDL